MALSFPLGITRCVPQVNSILFPDNKYVKDQACSVKMAEYCSRSFLCVFVDLDSVSARKQAKNNLANI